MIHNTIGTYRQFCPDELPGYSVQWDYGSWPDGLAKKDGANALSGARSLDTATTNPSKMARTKNLSIEYNATILSNLLAHKEGMGDHRGAALLKRVSPVAWQHINLHGRYEFIGSARSIDIDAIVLELSQLPITQAIAV